MANGLGFIPTSILPALVEGQKTLFSPAAPGATAAGGGKKLDPEKLKALAPALGVLAAYLASPKGYRGVGAGSGAEMMNLLAQQEEERRRYAKQEERQAWLDEMTRADWERQLKEREQREKYAQWMADYLEGIGEDIPATPGGYAITGTTIAPELKQGGDFFTLFGEEGKDQFKLSPAPGFDVTTTPEGLKIAEAPPAAAQPASAPQGDAFKLAAAPEYGIEVMDPKPGKQGDPAAAILANLIRQSGGDPKMVELGVNYLLTPKEQRPPARSVEMLLRVLDPENPYVGMLLQPGLTNEDFDKWAGEALKWKKEQGATPEEIERTRLQLELLRAQIAKTKAEATKTAGGGAGGAGEAGGLPTGKDMFDIYKSTVPEYERGDIDPFNWIYQRWGQPGLDVFNAWATKNPNMVGMSPDMSQTGIKTMEAMRALGYDDATIRKVDQLIRNAPGGKVKDPKTGKETATYGSIRNAIINAIKRREDPAIIAALMDRYDLNPKNKKMTEEDWYKLAGVKLKG